MNTVQTPIQDGTYTIQYQNGEHRTLRFETIEEEGFWNGKQKVGFMAGSDNESFTWVGHFDETGRLRVWQRARFDDTREQRFRRAVAIIADDQPGTGKAYAMMSGKCYRCNRRLTHPTSIEQGIGPECRRRRNETATERAATLRARAA